eukprot:CAMPEP_0177653796 /NCGR_PEP_ID=MMETSP0447-20121125/13942_1 /TAXON_ID=0 /ORGANISM="Stygamoeba regulata, Strain BSH-02190019" /LENGTH=194 /DNA_ID=CAMNT_0019157307 /DNA_START=284 /DNA_END=865 /DNA_ORIENTATION=+
MAAAAATNVAAAAATNVAAAAATNVVAVAAINVAAAASTNVAACSGAAVARAHVTCAHGRYGAGVGGRRGDRGRGCNRRGVQRAVGVQAHRLEGCGDGKLFQDKQVHVRQELQMHAAVHIGEGRGGADESHAHVIIAGRGRRHAVEGRRGAVRVQRIEHALHALESEEVAKAHLAQEGAATRLHVCLPRLHACL